MDSPLVLVGRFDQALYDAAQADVLHCRALYVAAVAAQTAGTDGRLSGQRTVLVARTALQQALAIRHCARGDVSPSPSPEPR